MLEHLIKGDEPTLLTKGYEIAYDVLLLLDQQISVLLSAFLQRAASSQWRWAGRPVY